MAVPARANGGVERWDPFRELERTASELRRYIDTGFGSLVPELALGREAAAKRRTKARASLVGSSIRAWGTRRGQRAFWNEVRRAPSVERVRAWDSTWSRD